MITLGLTGSIGMGKSTTAQMFADHGVPVWDADAAVHRLYSAGGAAVAPIAAVFPTACVDGAINRQILKEMIAQENAILQTLQDIVHPLVAQDRAAFLQAHADADLVLFDIPLLFETGADDWLDVTICVDAPADIQRARVLARPGMTEETFDMICANQMPNDEKAARADYVIPTLEIDATRDAVRELLAKLRKQTNA